MNVRVLVVDDEWAIRGLLREVLEAHGLEIVEAENGLEAQRKMAAAAVPFDLIITDLVMPERDGFETIQHVRAHHPDLKIIAISSASNRILLECARLMGASATIVKPFRPEEIIAALKTIGPLGREYAEAVATAAHIANGRDDEELEAA